MSELIKWVLILGFGFLFIGPEFILYIILAAIVLFYLVSRYPKWFS